MINIVDNLLEVSNWEKYQNVEGLERIREQTRKRVAKHRELKKLECNVTCNATVTQGNATDKERDIDKEKEVEREGKPLKRFAPPTLDEVKAYCEERHNGIDAETFIDFYASKDWMVGKNRMKDWKACVRTWEKRERKPQQGQPPKASNDKLKALERLYMEE